MMKALKEIGLIDPNPHPSLHPQGPEITWVRVIFLRWNFIRAIHFYEIFFAETIYLHID